jgi:hypothetical protein
MEGESSSTSVPEHFDPSTVNLAFVNSVKDSAKKSGSYVTGYNGLDTIDKFDLKVFQESLVKDKTGKDEVKMLDELRRSNPENFSEKVMACLTNGVSKQNIRKTPHGLVVPDIIKSPADLYRCTCLIGLQYLSNARFARTCRMMGGQLKRMNRWGAGLDNFYPYLMDAAVYLITHGSSRQAGAAIAVTEWKIKCLFLTFVHTKSVDSLVEGGATQSKLNSLIRNATSGSTPFKNSYSKKLPKPRILSGGGMVDVFSDKYLIVAQAVLSGLNNGQRQNAPSLLMKAIEENKLEIKIEDAQKAFDRVAKASQENNASESEEVQEEFDNTNNDEQEELLRQQAGASISEPKLDKDGKQGEQGKGTKKDNTNKPKTGGKR